MVSINGPGDLDLSPFDLETGMPVASEVWNLHSEFWHARPSGSRVIRYVRDGWTDRQTNGRTDKSKAYCPFPTGGGIIMRALTVYIRAWQRKRITAEYTATLDMLTKAHQSQRGRAMLRAIKYFAKSLKVT